MLLLQAAQLCLLLVAAKRGIQVQKAFAAGNAAGLLMNTLWRKVASRFVVQSATGSLVVIKVFHCNPLALRIQQHKALHHRHSGVYLQWVHACRAWEC